MEDKNKIKNRFFKTLEDWQQALTKAVGKHCPQISMKQLTAYSYYYIKLYDLTYRKK